MHEYSDLTHTNLNLTIPNECRKQEKKRKQSALNNENTSKKQTKANNIHLHMWAAYGYSMPVPLANEC